MRRLLTARPCRPPRTIARAPVDGARNRSRTLPDAARRAAARGPACHRALGKKGEAAGERWVGDRLGVRPAAWTEVAAGEGGVAVRGGAMGDRQD